MSEVVFQVQYHRGDMSHWCCHSEWETFEKADGVIGEAEDRLYVEPIDFRIVRIETVEAKRVRHGPGTERATSDRDTKEDASRA